MKNIFLKRIYIWKIFLENKINIKKCEKYKIK